MILLAAALPAPALAQRATVKIKVDASRASTRVVLTHSSTVSYQVRETDGRLEVVYATPMRAEPAQSLLDDDILARFEMRGETVLALFTGAAYRSYETFELRNPFRLVIDLEGSRDAGGAGAVDLPQTRRDPSRKIIVIDPGHGGVEKGASGPTGLEEKEVALDLAKRLSQILHNKPGLAVVLTREDDRLVGLDERTAIANYNQADLFLSIHINSSSRPGASGAETYFLSSDATDDAARTLAALENRAAGVTDGSFVTVQGERRDLEVVLWDLAQNQYLAESSVLAENVQIQLNQLTGTRDRGVRQAPFRVLMGATMPAILVEVGFISNHDEEARLRTPAYRNSIAQAMATAVNAFLVDLERLSRPALSGGSGASRP